MADSRQVKTSTASLETALLPGGKEKIEKSRIKPHSSFEVASQIPTPYSQVFK